MSNTPLILLNISLVIVVLWLSLKPDTRVDVITESGQTDNSAAAEIDRLKQRISLLEQDLSEDISARINLEQRLQAQQTTTTQQPGFANEPELARQDAAIDQPVDDVELAEEASVEERLISVGMPVETIQAMKVTVDQNQLEMLQLRDQAIREGWSDSEEYREQMFALRNPYRELREQFGDEAYDQYLYATGTPNRVQIRQVYTGSAAANAGLRPGDIVVSYADSSIYSMSTLRQSTLEGIAGETILLEINRDGQSFMASAPRGPLGISMSSVVVKPE